MRKVNIAVGALCLSLSFAGCDQGAPPAPRYFERVIQPILTANCVRNQGSCHKDDGTGNALGNLDLTSYAGITKRRDVLRTYGSFPVPLLLVKGAGKQVPPIPYQAPGGAVKFYPVQVDHAGGTTLSPESNAYYELLQWMANGANEDGRIVERTQQKGSGACRSDFAQVRPDVAAQLATVDTSTPAFQAFARDVEPVLAQSCAFGTCHSGEQSDFFITCKGSGTDDATKFNFLEAQQWVNAPAETSLVVLKPLNPGAGGIAHTGGVFFENRNDATWIKIRDWATAAGIAGAGATLSDGQIFFNEHVMPLFLQRGCAFEGCHSPGSANDFKLRAGTRGFLSSFSLASNYRFARHDFLVPEVPDVRQSRIVKKPIPGIAEGGYGIVHRGGPPLQTQGEVLDPSMCQQPWLPQDVMAPMVPSTAFCTFVEWHRLERADLLAKGQADPMPSGGSLPIVAVVRNTPDADRPIEFDTYRPNADLVISNLPLGALGVPNPAGASGKTTLLDKCPGTTSTRDVRQPDVSYDASRVAFAMRTSATDTLDVYEVVLADHACRKVTDGNGQSKNGILMHNLDPMYAPDGTLVFASTRGKAATGPTRSLKYLLPQTDLWRIHPDGAGGFGAPEQMTALLSSELNPTMMLDGRVAFTTEKATADFYQVSGRRINWDLTDYHPLLAQRSQSPSLDGMPHPSIGYQQATDIREGLDRNFLLILSDDGMKGGGGALASFNRSVGPFELDRGDINFLRSVTFFDPAATGRAATQGAYRNPVALTDGRILVSYAPDVTDLAGATSVRYDLVVLDPRNSTRAAVAGFTGGASYVDAAIVMKREQRALFKNYTQLIFGGKGGQLSDPSLASVHFPDLPMLSTLLGANLRTGRFVDSLRGASKVVFYEHMAPPSDPAAARAAQTGSQMVYSQLNMLGSAGLASDGSAHVRLPSLTPIIMELQDGNGNSLFKMTEEDQLGPGEFISRGVPQSFFNSVCGGCHGSVGGRELDVAIDPDALTSASISLSRDKETVIK